MSKHVSRSKSLSYSARKPILQPAPVSRRPIIMDEDDVDLEFDERPPGRRQRSVLLVEGGARFLADRAPDGGIANPEQVTPQEALRWFTRTASTGEGYRGQLLNLASLAADLLDGLGK